MTQFRNLLWVKNVKSEYFRGCNHLINQMSKLNKFNIFSIIYKMCVSMPFPWSVAIHPYDILLCMHTKVCVSKVPEHPVHPVCCQDPGEISLSSDEPLRCNTFVQTQILILPSLSLEIVLYLFYFHLSKIYLQGNTNISHPMWGKFWVLFAQGLWTWFAVVTNMHIFERRPHLKFSKIYLGFPCFLSLTWKMWISVMIFLIFCKVTKDKQ